MKTDDGTLLSRSTISSNDVGDKKNLIELQSDKIASEAIVEHILKTIK